jgi:hypothetical protein
MALVSALSGMFIHRVARASQLGPPTCGEQGAVCTLIAGCCDGFTCATSAINTSYGICVPGSGGMVSTGTTLISPFSETAVEDVTALVQTASTAPTTDPQAEREARIAEIRARKDTRRTTRRTRLDAKRTRVDTRKDAHHDRRVAAREEKSEAAEVALGPQLQLELVVSQEEDSKTTEVKDVQVETVKVTNFDDVNIVITRIESLLAPKDGLSLTTSPSKFTLIPGKSYYFVSGLKSADATNDRFDWTEAIACDTSPGAGYLVKAAFSVNEENHDFVILCEGSRTASYVETPEETSGRKRKRNHQQKKKKKR